MKENDLSRMMRCDQCLGCMHCGRAHCMYNVKGDYEICYYEICRYCTDYLQKPKLFLNNVG